MISAKVSTFGSAVVDAFYVRGPDGGKLTDPRLIGEVEAAIRQRVGSPSRTRSRTESAGRVRSGGANDPVGGTTAQCGVLNVISAGRFHIRARSRMPAGHAHSRAPRRRSRGRPGRGWTIAITLSTLAVVIVAAAAFMLRGPANRAVASPNPSPAAQPRRRRAARASLSVSPAAGTTGVPSDATISVRFSVPLSPHSPTPTLTPAVAGLVAAGDTRHLHLRADRPARALRHRDGVGPRPVPEGWSAPRAGHWPTPSTAQFTVAPGSTLRLQQLLAQLGYLPVTFTPAGPLTAPQEAAKAQQGSFNWRWTEPASLGEPVDRRDAQRDHPGRGDGLRVPARHDDRRLGRSGGVEPAPGRRRRRSRQPRPLRLRLRRQEPSPRRPPSTATAPPVYTTRANTGVAAAPTASGTFPVYVRYRVTTMTGTNPDGSKYVDPGIPWVSYFNGGDALHGFVRGGYGYPQSDGCVEMPPANAAVVYPLTPIGTLVTVS